MMFRTRKQKERIARELVDMSRRNSQFSEIFARLLRNKLGMVGFIIIIVLLVLVIFAPLFTSYPYDLQVFPERFSARKSFPGSSASQ